MLALIDRKMAGGINKHVKSLFALDLGIREIVARQVACICSAQESGRSAGYIVCQGVARGKA